MGEWAVGVAGLGDGDASALERGRAGTQDGYAAKDAGRRQRGCDEWT